MNFESKVISRLKCSAINAFDPETDRASETFVNICELIFRRGRVNGTPLITQGGNRCAEQIVFPCCVQAQDERTVMSLHDELKEIGYMGHPVVIEFLLLPISRLGTNDWSPSSKQIPAYLMERWIIQFLPKRLVTDTLSDLSKLFEDINSFCKSSAVNKVLFGDGPYCGVPELSELCCICRLTNLRRANLFSSCWFTISSNELLGENAKTDLTDFELRLIRDLTDNFNTSDEVHTTTRTKSPKRTYLCSSPCSHTHWKDNAAICVSKPLSRVLAGSREVLDTIVTSVLELPLVPLNDIIFDSLQCLHSGTMSLPTKRWNEVPLYAGCPNALSDDTSKCKVPKSPVVIMSKWTKPTSFLESPPCKLKRMQQDSRPRVDECISQFTSLSVQQQKQAQTNKSSKAEVCVPIADSVERHFSSKSFTESSFHSLSFNPQTGLPLQSSPMPIKQKSANNFDFDNSTFHSPSAKAHSNGANSDADSSKTARPTTLVLKRRSSRRGRTVSAPTTTSPFGGVLWGGGGVLMPVTPLPPHSSHQLLINFEESMLNGRIPPKGMVEGFSLGIGASGSFFPVHVKLPIVAYFFQLSDDGNTPSPYLGHVDLTGLSNKRGYHVPHKGLIQLTLFNPSHSVMKMFVIEYNLEDMPANSQTFLRQRTVYMPTSGDDEADPMSNVSSDLVSCVLKGKVESLEQRQLSPLSSTPGPLPIFLRYLVHLRFHTTKSNNLYLHTDIRLIFARDTFEFDPRVTTYRMHSFIDGPKNPRFSPKTC
ncbi:Uncharacterized protein ECG_00224 [Echinococcus granulosus]|nr:Uncharacterized protein ECG_00224 [Echinococcus granulosus]